MRANPPDSSQEFAFPKGQTLVSATDLAGRILYCNLTFIAVSGHEKEEVLGQPHATVCHPDLPEEAFRGLWEAIARGAPWSAPLKNRRKDGSYYWVIANVKPLMQCNRPTGCMWMQTEASREQIEEAERRYRAMGGGQAAA